MDLDEQRRARWVGAAVFAIVGVVSFPLLFGDPVDPRSTIRSRYASSRPVVVRPSIAPSPAPQVAVAQPVRPSPTPIVRPSPRPTQPAAAATRRVAPSPVATEPPVGAQRWTLQLASYTDAQSAQRFVQALRKEGLNPKVVQNDAGGRSVWRVRLELAGTRREAESLAARLNMQFRIQSLLLSRE